MTTKRSFLKSLMAIAATVALAPEIAFGVRLRMAKLPEMPTQWLPEKYMGASTWYDTKRDMFLVFREGKWVESGYAGQD